jgi:hypothetical protein
LANWLGVSIGYLLAEEEADNTDKSLELATPEKVVEVYLRADKHLSPQTAQALARMFRTLYEEFTEVQER